MEPEVVEIPAPIPRTSRMLRQKEIVPPDVMDVIDIDNDDDSADIIFINEKIDSKRKGKGIESIPCSSDDLKDKEALASCSSFGSEFETLGSINGVESKSFSHTVHNLINLEGHNSDLSFDEDEYIDLFSEDFMDVDEYAVLQAHFDHMDIPPGVEAPIPWLPKSSQKKKKHATGSGSSFTEPLVLPDSGNLRGMNSSVSEPAHWKMNGNSFVESVHCPPDVDHSTPRLPSQGAQSKKKSTASQNGEKSTGSHRKGSSLNISIGIQPPKSRWFLDPFKSKKKQVTSNSSTNFSSPTQLDAMKLHHGVEPSFWGQQIPDNVKKVVGSSSMYHPDFPVPINPGNHPPGAGSSQPWPEYLNLKKPLSPIPPGSMVFPPFVPLHVPPAEVVDMSWIQDLNAKNVSEAGTSTTTGGINDRDLDGILKKFEAFKQFDTVEDHSDHHYAGNGASVKQPSKNWSKRIQEEWKILEKDLPDTIFVRVYESRMDLLRAVIVGAEGTPYHDGLFFFDVFFPNGYPNVPPHVYYHSGGLRLNPNLYNCGKVCLSLLNTWSGNKNEKWIPGVSTMLQVLVSIQGLILNTKPYFNEPGYAHMSGSQAGEIRSQQYNEDTYILSLRTMVYNMRRPPKHFEDFVIGHFCKRAHDILVACKAYLDGAQVGCLVKGGVQDVDAGDKSCSKRFKESLSGYVDMLVKEFTLIGAKNCEKFLSPSTTASKVNGGAAIAR